jgi:choline-sulfatase
MRILYIDIDTLRPDHLGCYGYLRNTSPNIDTIARQGVRFNQCYITDAPCLPSRTALWSGRAGFHTGVINHGGVAADPFIEGQQRQFRDSFAFTSWMTALRRCGIHTVSVSPFAERHGAWHWYAGFSEMYNTGEGGGEIADAVTPYALDWLSRNAQKDNWFLHVNYWDPHTPYRTPMSYGNPFENDPIPSWITEEVRQRSWDSYGPHSAQEPHGYPHEAWYQQFKRYPRLPENLDSMASVHQWMDGYDTGIRYADDHTGKLFRALEEAGVFDDTVIMISSDHGESQGELGVWGDHQTADDIICRVPLIVRWPGLGGKGRLDNALHYHYDWAATMIELLGGTVPDNWDGRAFSEAFKGQKEAGRRYLVTSQGAWSCQRGVRFNHQGEAYLCLRTYHDGHKQLAPLMLFNLTKDPHELHELAQEHPELVDHAMGLLADWQQEMMTLSQTDIDPMMTVLREGGPYHTRGNLAAYVQHLQATGRSQHAEHLIAAHPDEI